MQQKLNNHLHIQNIINKVSKKINCNWQKKNCKTNGTLGFYNLK